MAVIGGIFNGEREPCDTEAMLGMSRTMLLRGGSERSAYINRGIGIFAGRGRGDAESCLCASREVEGKEKNLTAAVDGSPRSGDSWDSFSTGRERGAELVLSAYRSRGVKLGESLIGEFSVALCDEDRGELILLRDRAGSRPLFYAKEGSTVAFASEIKGIMRFMTGTAVVDLCRLREHIFSPHTRRGADLYRDIYEIPPCGGCVCTRLGVDPFVYSYPQGDEGDYISSVAEENFICPEKKELRNLLRDTLFAFDYPEFDPFMPAFIENIRKVKRSRRGFVAVEDGTLCLDMAYSSERKDRLCAYYGSYVRCVAPKNGMIRERELRNMERTVWQIFDEIDKSAVFRVYGDNIESLIRSERSVAKRIRGAAILYQTSLWQKNYNLIFV